MSAMTFPQVRPDFDAAAVDAVFRDIDRCSLPGAAVGIALHGVPIYRKGFGIANIEAQVMLSPSTRMRIGSITKHFTCLAFLLISDDGPSRLHDPICTYLPWLNPAAGSVTVWQLMSHVSGIRDVLDICYQFSGLDRGIPVDRLRALYGNIDDVNAAPGATWLYNNGGYILLSAAIERIADDSLQSVFRKRLFEPVGMSSSLLRCWDDDFVGNSATLHYPRPDGTYSKTHMGTELTGEGGIVSTVDDMLAWLAAMDTPVLGTREFWDLLTTPGRLNNGASTGYGLGFFMEDHHGVKILRHAGGVLGGTAELMKVPSAGLDIIVITNRGDLSATLLAEQVLDYCLPGLILAPRKSTRRLLHGNFRSPVTGRVVELFGRAEQQLAAVDGMEMPFDADEEGVLRTSGIWKHQRTSLVPIPDWNAPTSIQFDNFGSPDELTLTTATSEPSVNAIFGSYASTATATDALVLQTDEGQPELIMRGAFGTMAYTLRFLGDNLWRAISTDGSFMGGTLYFESHGSSFVFNTFRTVNLRFRRMPKDIPYQQLRSRG